MAEFTLPNMYQIQNMVDKPSEVRPRTDTLEMKLAPVIQQHTLVSGSATELGDPLASRNRIVIKNLDSVRTARIGASGVTGKVGYLLEPKHELTISFDTGVAVSVYGIATGAELAVEVIES